VLPSEIASIASAFSGVTATISLIYVGIQIRLSMRHTRAQIQQGTTARTTSILLGQMNAEAAAICSAASVEERRFHQSARLNAKSSEVGQCPGSRRAGSAATSAFLGTNPVHTA
jgi:hypothetical protein